VGGKRNEGNNSCDERERERERGKKGILIITSVFVGLIWGLAISFY
jgi:hypothetical protein